MKTLETTPGPPMAIGANDQDLAAEYEVGEYRIEGVIGKGGFGTVYGAVHPLIGKRVAIKVLSRKFSADPAIVSRFVAEARAVNQIRHRNIIDIFSFGQLSDGRHYYVMEYLEGVGLDEYLKTHGPVPLDEALPFLRAIARALDAAHAKGIAHRDLKPENIFLAQDPDGEQFPKLLDFGIAKLLAPEEDVRHRTGTGVPMGTPYYMSPEQCRGREIDHRTDIYSFGIVVYRVLTGAFPFEGDDYVELMFKQTGEQPALPSSRNPALPASVDTAIAWMMQKDREKRPPSVLEGINALDPTARHTPVPPARGSRPSVAPVAYKPSPSELELASTSAPNALAASDTLAAVTPGTLPSPSAPNVLGATSSPNALAARSSPNVAHPEAPRTSRSGLFIVLAFLLLGGGAAGALMLVNRTDKPVAAADPAPTKPEPPKVVEPPVVAKVEPADAAVAPPAYVTVELRAPKGDLPGGTIVTLGGKKLGIAPNVSVPYATSEVNLTIEAPGHLPAALPVIPDKDQQHRIEVTKKPRGKREPKRDDLIDVFPGAGGGT